MGEATSMNSQETIAGDLSCARCGYNVRTLALSTVCPECACPWWAWFGGGGGWLEGGLGGVVWGGGLVGAAPAFGASWPLLGQSLSFDPNSRKRWLNLFSPP